MAQQKESALSKVARRQMAQLLEVGKEESARIRVENIIRQDISVELMEILELYCELLLARIGLMEAKYLPPSPPPPQLASADSPSLAGSVIQAWKSPSNP